MAEASRQQQQQQQKWGVGVTEPLSPLPDPDWSPHGLGWRVGRTHPRISPSPPWIASLGAQPISSGRRLRHTERRKWERRTQERRGSGRMKAEVRGVGEAPTPPLRPFGEGARKPHHHAACWEARWDLRLRGPKAGWPGAGLSRSHASRCAQSRTPALHPRT